MRINPAIFKAYDIRGLYPGEINEEVARQIGRGFVALPAARSGSASRATCASRRRRIAAAFIEGAREQGADVIDYGMLGTDMLYFAVVNDDARRRRADHRVAQPEAGTTASRWCAPARCRSAATRASATSAT